MLNPGHVAVVGSANLDIVMALKRVPHPGETVMGDHLEETPGGKGANQAIGAARNGAAAFIGCVGLDEAGTLIRRGLDQASVDTRYLLQCGEPTGRAFIQVTPDGENSIVVIALANSALNPDHVIASLDALRPVVVLTQLEVPYAAVKISAGWAQKNRARFVLNPSPIMDLPRSLLECCDPLIVNAEEGNAILSALVGPELPARECPGIEEVAARIAEVVISVVVTDGGGGACVGTAENGISRITGKKVKAIDTTGAGDEFAGALARGLALGFSLERSAEMANEAAALLVQVARNDRNYMVEM